MEEQIEARVSPSAVWKAWEKAHMGSDSEGARFEIRKKGKLEYKIFDLKEGESFSIVWKSFLVRLIFQHRVEPIEKGSLITYKVAIKGPFGWLVRWFIGEKIRKNISSVLKAVVKELEGGSIK